MNDQVKRLIINSLLLGLIVGLPMFLMGLDPIVQYCVYLIIDVILAYYAFNFLYRSGAFEKSVQDPLWKHILMLSPTLLILLPLPLAYLLAPEYTIIRYEGFDGIILFLEVLKVVFSMLIDCMLFFMYYQKQFKIKNRALKILAVAGLFTLFNLFSSISYTGFGVGNMLLSTFVLGVCLAAIYEYGHYIYPCMIIDLIYLGINEILGEYVLNFASITHLLYLILPALVALYLVVIYFAYFKKKEFDYYVQ